MENSRDVIYLVGASVQDAYFFVKDKQTRSRENYFYIQNFARNSLASYWICAVTLCSHIPVEVLFNLQFPLSNMEAKVGWRFPPFATNSNWQLPFLGLKHLHSSCTFPLSILFTFSFPSQSFPKIYNKTQAPSIESELAWTSICLLSNVRKILFQHMPALTATLPCALIGTWRD